MNMGQSLVIQGELVGGEDLTLDGKLEGKISLPDHVLTVGTNANIDAEILAKVVIILGAVKGNVTAKEKFEVRAGGSIDRNAFGIRFDVPGVGKLVPRIMRLEIDVDVARH